MSSFNCRCIGCGELLNNKELDSNYCIKCILGAKISLNENNHGLLLKEIENIFNFFISDVSNAFNRDPAAKNIIEILSCYPGIQATVLYRVAHLLWICNIPLIPRYISYVARQITDVDIHPGAKIGKNFFIDHGGGVVIGETAEIGDNVTMYQGSTLGGVSIEQKKRHPTLGNNIIVGAGAKILGAIKIGNNVRIGANSVVTKDIPDNSIVVGVPGRIISKDNEINKEISLLSHGILPDPILKLIEMLEQRIIKLEHNNFEIIEDYCI